MNCCVRYKNEMSDVHSWCAFIPKFTMSHCLSPYCEDTKKEIIEHSILENIIKVNLVVIMIMLMTTMMMLVM